MDVLVISCPICEYDKHFTHHISNFERLLYICKRCKVGFFLCDLSEDELSAHYEKNYSHYLKDELELFTNKQHFVSEIRAEKLRSLVEMIEAKVIVDYGSSFPLTLASMRRDEVTFQRRFIAIELNSEARSWGIEHGIEAYANLNEWVLNSNLNPDVDTCLFNMSHVLEHLPNPLLFLTHLRHLLPANSMICGAVPNFHSSLANNAGDNWEWLSYPEHLTYFNPYSLFVALLRGGYTDIAIDSQDEVLKLSTFLEEMQLDPNTYMTYSSKLLLGNELIFRASVSKDR